MKNSLHLGFLILFSHFASVAQTLQLNDVNAKLNNNGILFMKQGPSAFPGYEVPKFSGTHAVFAASIWCGGEDANGQLRLAAMRYGQLGKDFFPGPYSSTNDYTSAAYTAEYDNSVWRVLKSEVLNHLSNYTATSYVLPQNLATWPANGISGVGVAQNLAPFIDLNDNGLYEPMLGEYPDIRGDEAVYMIMNDAKSPHTETGGEIMGIEIHTMAYQYFTNDYRNRTTYLNYRVFNRGAISYQNFKMSMWWDPDLGNSQDDYVGCDTLTNMMYVYNGDNVDETSGITIGYQINPPAVGIRSLTKKMDGFAFFTNGAQFPYSDPSTADQYFNFMNGKWANGSTMYVGGLGALGTIGSTTVQTNYLFSGNPNNAGEWSELSLDGATASAFPGDRRGVMSMEAESLLPGSSTCYDFAILYSREAGNNVQNVNSLITQAAVAKTDFDDEWRYNCDQVTTLAIEKLDEAQLILFPNPSDGTFTIHLGENLSGEIKLLDLTGRLVYQERFENKNSRLIELNEKPGIYQLILTTDKGTVHKKVSIQE